MPLPQHVASCRGSQLKQVFSGFQAGMPQETAPHAPQDKGQCFVETSITAAQPDKP